MSTNSSLKSTAQPSPPASAQNKPCILVIDDSRMIRISLTRILKKEFDILEAADGEQGWQILSENQAIQVVITDADMPILNGYDLITRIRNHEDQRIQQIPVIMITGAEEDHIREKALQTGATDFIVKPPDKTQLLARVRAYAKADTTSRKLSEEATTDALTKVSSKRYFFQRGEQDLAFAKRHAKDMSVIAIALDNFQEIIKQHGTKTAKSVLIEAAAILKSTVRTEDTVARVGDFTFAIIAPNSSQLESATLCIRAKDTLAATDIEGVNVTASLGLTCLSQDKHSAIEGFLDLAVKRATTALKEGGNKLVAWQMDQQPQVSEVVPASETASVTEPVAEPEITDLNEALATLNTDEQKLVPSLKGLVLKVMPLLELANRVFRWEIDEQLKAIRQKLDH